MKTINENEKSFTATLLSIANQPKENINGKLFRNASIEFPNINGELVKRQGIIYEKNFSYGMSIGNQYLAVAKRTENGVIITISHLANADLATIEDFGF
jgi:hypothetical protein